MRFLCLITTLALSTQAYSIEKVPEQVHELEDSHTYSSDYDRASSDLKVRELQKLVNEGAWNIKAPKLEKNAKK